MVKCKDQKNIEEGITFDQDFPLYDMCTSTLTNGGTVTTVYCLKECVTAPTGSTGTSCPDDYTIPLANVSTALPVGDKYIISYTKQLWANNAIDIVENEKG